MIFIGVTYSSLTVLMVIFSISIIKRGDMREMGAKNEKEVFYKVTGLDTINDRVLEAAYSVHQFIEKAPIRGSSGRGVKGDIKIDMEELFSGEDRESLMLISNLSKGIKKYGFNTYFNIRELAKALDITPTIAKKWLNEAVNRGLVTTETDKDGGVIYSFNRDALAYFIDNLERSIIRLKQDLAGETSSEIEEVLEDISEVKSFTVEGKIEFEEGLEKAKDFEEIKFELFDILDKMEEIVEKKADELNIEKKISFIEKVKSLRKELGEQLVFEIIDCRRLQKVAQVNVEKLSRDHIEKCSKALESLKERFGWK
ncbi:MAG: hypothetical protein ACP6IP_04865 [Candidatus Njordarchaeia archaeon]